MSDLYFNDKRFVGHSKISDICESAVENIFRFLI